MSVSQSMVAILIKFKIKHPKTFNFLKESGKFLFIFIIVFILVFGTLNGRAFYNQIKYKFGLGIKSAEEFLKELKLPSGKIGKPIYSFPDTIIIPKINLNAPIVSASNPDPRELLKLLEKGVVHFPASPVPGQIGNSIILGHSSAYPWYKGKYGSVFSLLNYLKPGDEIIVYYRNHKYVYRVTNKKTINSKNISIPEQNQKAKLILISCWPVGTNWGRVLVEAELIK